ncbi:MAG TPA: glutathione S-transferase family protein [Burkholderiales bacterium]|nr:glutathione S-transferase family protein [Burkholderiales bacterium]
MLRIWGRKNSINVQKVLWCCGELGLPFERIDAGMQFGVNDTPEYRAMNPNGLVPTIDDDGFILWESHAIVRYLARKRGVGNLWPEDAQTAADADRWMEWYSTTLWQNVRPVFWTLVRTPPEKRNMAEVEEHRKKLAANFAIVDAQLSKREYLAGARFSMGDIPMGVAAYRWFKLPIERPDYRNLERWYERLCKRPAFQEHCMLLLT